MIKAVIFDMDGVISDTQNLLAKCEQELLRKHGITLSSEQITREYAGVSEEFFFKDVFEKAKVKLVNLDSLINERRELIFANAKNNIKEIPGAITLAKLFRESGYPLSVASGSNLHFIRLVLSELKAEHLFNEIVSSEEVTEGKPNPDIFYLAAKRLGVKPEDCLVIEDGKNGMIGAKKAGMKCIGLVEKKDYTYYPADLLVTHLNQITIDTVKSL